MNGGWTQVSSDVEPIQLFVYLFVLDYEISKASLDFAIVKTWCSTSLQRWKIKMLPNTFSSKSDSYNFQFCRAESQHGQVLAPWDWDLVPGNQKIRTRLQKNLVTS